LPGVPSELPTKIPVVISPHIDRPQYPGKGFQDYKNANYPKYKEETDVNRLAVNDSDLPHSTLTIRKSDRTISVGRADFAEDEKFINNIPTITEPVKLAADDGTAFSEPEIPYDATYPYNHVYESEAGHIREMDDTPGKERIHERHATGTGYEIHPDGTKVVRTKMDNYDLTYGQHYTHIRGSQSTTVNGGVRVFVNASGEEDYHYTIQVGKNANVNIQVDDGDVNVVTKGGDINLHSGRNLNLHAEAGLRIQAQTVDIGVNLDWKESVSVSKTENTGHHQMNSTTTTIVGPDNINLNP
jgi:hypothetical protein